MAPLFHIIRKDTEGLLKILRRNLEDMNMDILGDARMEDRLTLWRQLISRAQFELPELKRSMNSFFSFFKGDITATETYNNLTNNHQVVALEEYQDLSNQIDDVLQKLQVASAALISNMGLLESKRSIAEAQSVTKLTELAFFFIPLTFAASIFGMQIEQFEDRAPLSTFIILGLAFTAFSYLVRLLIRSMWIRRLNEACAESIKFYADRKRVPLQRGFVPASLFVQWMGFEIKGLTGYFFRRCWHWIKTTTAAVIRAIPTSMLIILIIAVGPIAVLWTRDMDHGIQAIITAIPLVSIIVLVGILPKLRINPKKVLQTIDSKDLKKRIRQCLSTHHTFFNIALWTCLIAIAVVPLTLVWVRPVAPGIKAAITALVVLGVILGFISYGIYKLVAAARMVNADSSNLDSSSSAND